ncbi:hypothetical protein [Sulfurovum sp.]|uniref:hypothetical protein n=1 Tax=Sulfurovum sp. TaxID=1969726 RepID=UPI0025E32655|nr:hypothetical protein [Sulfurovum sp.]
MKQKLNNLKNNPQFQEKLQQMKPNRSIWGVLGVVLVFFVPEIMSCFWSDEINFKINLLAQSAPSRELGTLLEWMGKELFNGQISWVNVGLGVVFLVWLFRK